ncbi:MAG: hypothetical protein O2905_06730, partial [Proteobacteria bacterium]|nr:hypothetical protein [Pseudomonadota bacterium]
AAGGPAAGGPAADAPKLENILEGILGGIVGTPQVPDAPDAAAPQPALPADAPPPADPLGRFLQGLVGGAP